MDYLEKLKDPRWQKKRLEILERDGWKCMCCGNKDRTLHVHHIFYFPQKEPWDIPNGFLITFCERCHNPNPMECAGVKACEKCGAYGGMNGCDGMGDPKEELLSCISSLLDTIWKNDSIGDFYVNIGVIATHLDQRGNKNGQSAD